ncbi:MAG: bifunctional phosphoribosylaminoimidazolecarboxamide formyltransferase/IMP cyclohydrolase [Bacteroidetes bacterium]|jgi:phosphoribosylaminoimidazolecarboxamide formyltransferase/IMP cyclohydrolase|nr:bifunctional phosphoribosylaminoimidazolecarboxamide formyltransferase/IMP cyclohydrolase [Bacteroidota bacterium]
MTIKSALISVYSKEGIDELALALAANNVAIYSTGGTKKYLENLGLDILAVEDYTNYPEVFGGRVKTLHPAIFGGILYRRDNVSDLQELTRHNIPAIDLVVVDLYPFEDTVDSGANHQDIIEKIDIGGISLIRAAAKNYKHTCIISNRSQYAPFTSAYKANNGHTTIEYRKELAGAAFKETRRYDTAIAGYFANEQKIGLRYGENPHQKAHFEGDLDALFTKISGKELSYNNLLDIDAAVSLIQDVSEEGKCSFAVLKHNNACGCAKAESISEAFSDALAADPVSAFGGILISDSEIDLATAQEIDKIFYEVCIAPSFSAEAKNLLTKKAKRILLEWSKEEYSQPIVRSCLNGVLWQERDTKNVTIDELTYPTEAKPAESQIKDLLLADRLVKNTKSNAIILVKEGKLISSGTGQTSRVDALRQAIVKANAFNLSLEGAVMASDAFFPFPDCVEIAAEAGIVAVIQPGGSIKDNLSIAKCNELNVAMAMTSIRHFKH